MTIFHKPTLTLVSLLFLGYFFLSIQTKLTSDPCVSTHNYRLVLNNIIAVQADPEDSDYVGSVSGIVTCGGGRPVRRVTVAVTGDREITGDAGKYFNGSHVYYEVSIYSISGAQYKDVSGVWRPFVGSISSFIPRRYSRELRNGAMDNNLNFTSTQCVPSPPTPTPIPLPPPPTATPQPAPTATPRPTATPTRRPPTPTPTRIPPTPTPLPGCRSNGTSCSLNSQCCSNYCSTTCRTRPTPTPTLRPPTPTPTRRPTATPTPLPGCRSNGTSCSLNSQCCSNYCSTTCRTRPTPTPTRGLTPTPAACSVIGYR